MVPVVTLTSSKLKIGSGNSVTITGTVAAANGLTPTGILTIYADGVAIGNGVLVKRTFAATTSTLPVGSHMITASYSGDPNFAPANATAITQVIAATPVVTLTSSTTTTQVLTPITLTATVAPVNGLAPTGTVSFYDVHTLIGTVNLQGGSSGPLSASVTTLQTGNLAAGSHPFTFTYSGDAHYFSGTSSAVRVTVNKFGFKGATLHISPSPAKVGQNVTFTVTIATTSGYPAPTGQIKLFENNNFVSWLTLVDGVATYQSSTFANGIHQIAAQYTGDANYSGGKLTGSVVISSR